MRNSHLQMISSITSSLTSCSFVGDCLMVQSSLFLLLLYHSCCVFLFLSLVQLGSFFSFSHYFLFFFFFLYSFTHDVPQHGYGTQQTGSVRKGAGTLQQGLSYQTECGHVGRNSPNTITAKRKVNLAEAAISGEQHHDTINHEPHALTKLH